MSCNEAVFGGGAIRRLLRGIGGFVGAIGRQSAPTGRLGSIAAFILGKRDASRSPRARIRSNYGRSTSLQKSRTRAFAELLGAG